jgi:hypothetical protein
VGDRLVTAAQVEVVVAGGIGSETEVFPVAVALVIPALSAEVAEAVEAAPAAVVHAVPLAWGHPAVVVDRGVVVAAADGADESLAHKLTRRSL